MARLTPYAWKWRSTISAPRSAIFCGTSGTWRCTFFTVASSRFDPDDAALVLELLLRHRDRLRLWKADDARTRQLRLLVEYRRKLVDDRTALLNQLTQLLKESFPQALRWAGGLDTKQAFDFLLRWPTLAAVRQARTQQLRAFYRTHSHSAEHIEKQIDAIRTAIPLLIPLILVRNLRSIPTTVVICK